MLENIFCSMNACNTKIYQPYGILHREAILALADTIGSAAKAVFNCDLEVLKRIIEISANHIKSLSESYVTGTVKYLHVGRTSQLWQINVFDDNQNLISICKLTALTLQKKT